MSKSFVKDGILLLVSLLSRMVFCYEYVFCQGWYFVISKSFVKNGILLRVSLWSRMVFCYR